jgi:hypothetical protein
VQDKMAIQNIARIDTDGTQKFFYLLNLLDIRDDVSAALVMHEYVNADGAFIQNLGQHPRKVIFKTYWFGNKTNTNLNDFTSLNGLPRSLVTDQPDLLIYPNFQNHYAFLQDMADSKVSHTFIHPKYGTLYGYVHTLRTLHNDIQDYVEIDIDFVVKDIQNESFTANIEDVVVLQTKAMDNFLSTMSDLMSSSGLSDLIGKTVTATQTLRSQITDVSQYSREFLSVCDSVLSVWDNFLSTVTQPFSILDQNVNFINDIPSRILGSINGSFERAISSMNNFNALPVQVTQNCIQYAKLLGQTLTSPTAFNTYLNLVLNNCGAVNIAGAVQTMLVTDNNNDKSNQQIENRQTFDPAGNRVLAPDPISVMSVQDLENMLYAFNLYIQSVIELNRANGLDVQDLLTLALQIKTYVDVEKLNRKQVVNITTNNIPLHLLITRMGLDYNAVDRVLKLNPSIKNPTFSEGPVSVYAY